MITNKDHLVEIAVMPKSGTDRKKAQKIMAELLRNTCCSFIDPESGQTMIGAMSESQLDEVITELKTKYGDNFEVGAPQINYHFRHENNQVTVWEPVMVLDVVTPRKFSVTIAEDIHKRRGRISDRKGTRDELTIKAEVPLGSMFGYEKHLKDMTHQSASCSMRFSHYSCVPLGDDDPSPFRPAMAMRAVKGK